MRLYYQDETHRIYHGNCHDLWPLLSEPPRLILADPPYGKKERTERHANGRSHAMRARDWPRVEGDNEPFDPQPVLQLQTATILWGANFYADKLPPSASWLVWDKRDGSTPDDNADCELAWSNLGGPARLFRHLWRGSITASEKQRKRHPTQKPVALMRWCLLQARLQAGALVLDPYMGSGPIAQACKELGLRYIGVDLVEHYCAEAVDRLSQQVIMLPIESIYAAQELDL